MKILKRIILIIVISLTFSCQGQDCDKLGTNFTSYQSALKTIKATDFSLTDKCDTRKSSWIYGAEFHSCDKQFGYFLLTTKKKTYIHKKVPIELWSEFKKADSFGKFYNSRIKNKYQLII